MNSRARNPRSQLSLVDDGSSDDQPEDEVPTVEPPVDSDVSLDEGAEELHFEAVAEDDFVDAAEEIPLGLLDDEPEIEAQFEAQPGFETVGGMEPKSRARVKKRSGMKTLELIHLLKHLVMRTELIF